MLFKRGNASFIAQAFLGEVLSPGSVAVDATAGNGRDTLYLARAVGAAGRVYAFDIQPRALQRTADLLREHHLQARVRLICSGHQDLRQYLTEPASGFMFNLGYLPGADHSCTTLPDTTVQALQSALGCTKPGGRIAIVVYTGHPGARAEGDAVQELAAGLDPASFGVLKVSFLNRTAGAPFLILMERMKQ